jgi:hypothetical protein
MVNPFEILFTAGPILRDINRKLDLIMADLEGLKAAAQQISTDVEEAVAALEDLAAKAAAGDVSQEDVDAITAQLSEAGQRLDAARETAGGTEETPPTGEEPQVNPL